MFWRNIIIIALHFTGFAKNKEKPAPVQNLNIFYKIFLVAILRISSAPKVFNLYMIFRVQSTMNNTFGFMIKV